MRIFSRLLPVVVAALAGCGSSTVSTSEPPPSIHGGWTRTSLTEAKNDALPESIRSLPSARAWSVTYRGPHDMTGVWIVYPSETVAFEALQKLNKGPSIWPIRIGPVFLVLQAEGIPRQALGDFQEGVVKAIQ